MLDASLHPVIKPLLARLASPLVRLGMSANQVTLTGFAIGMLAMPLLSIEAHGWALAAIGINRLSDGLDGAIARATGGSDLGGYLDITCDFIFYSAVIFGFAWANPTANALPAAFLIFSFIGTGSSFLAYAIIDAKRASQGRRTSSVGGRRRASDKAFAYLGGITEGSETIILLVLICLLPESFVVAAWVFGGLCWITTFGRMAAAWRDFAASG